MTVGLQYGLASSNSGTLSTNAGSTTVSTIPNSTTLRGDLVYVVAYTGGDPTGALDAGDGWKLETYTNAGSYGLVLGLCIAPRDGNTGWAGITLPTSQAWTSQCGNLRLVPPAKWDANFWFLSPDQAYIDASSNTTLQIVATGTGALQTPHYGEIWQIAGRGYNNGGTTTTSGNITGWTERFDVGQTSPAHGIVGNDRLQTYRNTTTNLNGTLAVAKTNRIGAFCAAPIIAESSLRRRSLGTRRVA